MPYDSISELPKVVKDNLPGGHVKFIKKLTTAPGVSIKIPKIKRVIHPVKKQRTE